MYPQAYSRSIDTRVLEKLIYLDKFCQFHLQELEILELKILPEMKINITTIGNSSRVTYRPLENLGPNDR